MHTKLNAKQQAKASATTRPAVYIIQARLAPFREPDIRCYGAGDPIFGRPTGEKPGPYGQWEFVPAGDEEGVFKIKNVGLDRFIVVGYFDRLIVAYDEPEETPAEFRVQPAGDGLVVIKQSNGDKVWAPRTSNPAYCEVVLDAADGSEMQKFRQIAVDP